MQAPTNLADSMNFKQVLKGRKTLDELITVENMPLHVVTIVKDQLWLMWKSAYWTVTAELTLQKKLLFFIADFLKQEEASQALPA